MRVLIALLTVGVVAAGVCGSEPSSKIVEWQGHVLREVWSMAQIPAALQSGLGVDRPGLDGIADRGRPFNRTDVVDEHLPMRRFLVAGTDGETWLVALERGGRGYSVEVFLFAAREPVAKRKWILLDRPDSLAEVVREISHGGHEG